MTKAPPVQRPRPRKPHQDRTATLIHARRGARDHYRKWSA
jgi:hypothetical protein